MQIQLSEHFTYGKLIKFTIPTIIMMIFTSIYGVVDGLFISNVAGSSAFASVNLIMPAIMILGSIGFMIGTGGSALVSLTLGMGDKERANKIFSMLIYVLIIAGLVFSIAGFFVMEPIAKLLGADETTLENCVIYGQTLMFGLTPFLLQNAFQSFLVVAERPKMGLVISLICGVTNMVLDFLFVYVFKWGVFGAAFATGISQFIGSIVPVIYFLRPNKSPLRLVKTTIKMSYLIKTCTNGSSEMLTKLSLSLVNMLYNIQLIKLAGSDGVVAYGIIMYVGFIFAGTYIGYSIGAAPIVGYHYGAGNIKELKSLLKKSVILLAVSSIVLTGIAEILASPLAGVFVSYDKNLLDMTTVAIRIYVISYIFAGFNIFASAFFTALNNGFISALISFLRTLVFQVLMIYLLPYFWGLEGIWMSVIFAEVLSLIVSAVCFIINRKKYQYF